MTRVRGGRGLPLGLIALVLAGCGGPSQAERRAQVDEAWREVSDASAEAIGQVSILFPNLQFVDTGARVPAHHWSDCSASSAGSSTEPTAVAWSSLREVTVEPTQETAGIADSLATWLEGQGWEALRAEDQDGGHLSTLSRDGYSMRIISDAVVPADREPVVRVIVYSPCLQAPENMGDWTPPTDFPTPAANPTG